MVWISRMAALVVIVGLLAVAFPTPVQGNPAKSGMIKDLFPPGTYRGGHGAGRIVEDGTGTVYVFQTPDDVSAIRDLSVGMKVTFENPVGRQATQVREFTP